MHKLFGELLMTNLDIRPYFLLQTKQGTMTDFSIWITCMHLKSQSFRQQVISSCLVYTLQQKASHCRYASYKAMLSQYAREKAKYLATAKKNGSVLDDIIQIKWTHFKALKFLDSAISARSSKSNTETLVRVLYTVYFYQAIFHCHCSSPSFLQ